MVATLPVVDRRTPRVRDGADLWQLHNGTTCFGCVRCPDRLLCGGLAVERATMDCTDLCSCTDPLECGNVCIRNPARLVARVREVRGFGFDNVPRADSVRTPTLPAIVPEFMHGKRRSSAIPLGAVAVPLHRMFYARTGRLRFHARGNLEAAFKVRPRLLVLDGVAEDRHLENYWAAARLAGFADAVRTLRPDLITVPNFSLFTDVPRWDNLYNMKRIAICWHELQAAGNAVALHVNARTDRDYDRWGAFLREHREIIWIAFEFATGAAAVERGYWHTTHLRSLVDKAHRPLNIVIRGGRQHLATLRCSYRDLTFISADPFMRTMKRRRLRLVGTRGRWTPTMTFLEQPLDDLLADNITAFERLILQGADTLSIRDRSMTAPRLATRAGTDGVVLNEFAPRNSKPVTGEVGTAFAPMSS